MRPYWQTLHLKSAATGSAEAVLPAGAAGQWCSLRLLLPGPGAWWARLEITDPTRRQVVRSLFLGPARTAPTGLWRQTLLHVPAMAGALTLRVWGAEGAGALLRMRIHGRALAAARLLWQGRALIPACWRGDPAGLLGRLRAVLGQAPARAGEAPPYSLWVALCEPALPGPGAPPPLDIQPVILVGAPALLAATQASLAAQTLPAPHPAQVIGQAEDWRCIAARWIVLLDAGETLAPQAIAWFSRAAADRSDVTCITADLDTLDAQGARCEPVFLPGADPLLAATGLPTAGPCALRWQRAPDLGAAAGASALRAAMGAVPGLAAPPVAAHVPRILGHRPAGAPPVRARPVRPLREPTFCPPVTALVPSAARAAHVVSCLRRVTTHTRYPHLQVHVLLSAPRRAEPRIVRRLRALPGLSLHELPRTPFNYAATNNAGAAQLHDAPARGELLLLLNDDVAPLDPGWLDAMVAHMQDPAVGIVGARLLYGNDMVQHEGVIMGLADLCEHAGRLRQARDAGPHGLAHVSRSVSAVTAACMLIRADLFRTLGGMDEEFAIALNDVDLCLRAGEAGWRVVYCAEAQLHHYESLSLGRHYEGARAALESHETLRLRRLWGDVIAADPCYNPQASLEPGREWQPAFPPRPG